MTYNPVAVDRSVRLPLPADEWQDLRVWAVRRETTIGALVAYIVMEWLDERPPF